MKKYHDILCHAEDVGLCRELPEITMITSSEKSNMIP